MLKKQLFAFKNRPHFQFVITFSVLIASSLKKNFFLPPKPEAEVLLKAGLSLVLWEWPLLGRGPLYLQRERVIT